MDFTGTIIEESLRDKSILEDVKILETKIVKVTPESETPWLEKWTMHLVSVAHDEADIIAEKVSAAIDAEHIGSWYADFKNERLHYVIFSEKIFKIKPEIQADWEAMRAYAHKIGLPKHQTL